MEFNQSTLSAANDFKWQARCWGRGVLALLAAVAEDERDRLRERTRAGMQASRRGVRHVGRPYTLRPEKLDLARRLIEEGKGRTVAAGMFGVHPATLRPALNGPDDLRAGKQR